MLKAIRSNLGFEDFCIDDPAYDINFKRRPAVLRAYYKATIHAAYIFLPSHSCKYLYIHIHSFKADCKRICKRNLQEFHYKSYF